MVADCFTILHFPVYFFRIPHTGNIEVSIFHLFNKIKLSATDSIKIRISEKNIKPMGRSADCICTPISLSRIIHRPEKNLQIIISRSKSFRKECKNCISACISAWSAKIVFLHVFLHGVQKYSFRTPGQP